MHISTVFVQTLLHVWQSYVTTSRVNSVKQINSNNKMFTFFFTINEFNEYCEQNSAIKLQYRNKYTI